MQRPDPRFERFKLFMNEPLMRRDPYTPKKFDVAKAVNHIVSSQIEKQEQVREQDQKKEIEDTKKRLRTKEDIDTIEIRQALQAMHEFQSRIDSLGSTTRDFSNKVDMNMQIVSDDETKITKMIEGLNSRFHNLNTLYEKIENSKKALNDILNRFGEVKKLTDENIDLKFKLGKAAEEKSKILIDRPLLRREEMSMLENDMFSLRTQNENLKKNIKIEKERLVLLENDNRALNTEKKKLKLTIENFDEEKQLQIQEYKDVQFEKKQLADKLVAAEKEIENLRRKPGMGRKPLSIWDSPQKPRDEPSKSDGPPTEAISKLMDQNERLISEINTLKAERAKKVPTLDELQNATQKDLLMAHKEIRRLEDDKDDLNIKVKALEGLVDKEKASNEELKLSLAVLEGKYRSLNIEHQSLKNSFNAKRGIDIMTNSPISTPRRIFDRENSVQNLTNDGSVILYQVNSPQPGNIREENEKLKQQLEAEKRWNEHLASELAKNVKKQLH